MASKKETWVRRTDDIRRKEVFQMKLVLLEQVAEVLNNCYCFGSFIRDLIHQIFSLRKQNARPGSNSLDEHTFVKQKSDVDILATINLFREAIGMKKNTDMNCNFGIFEIKQVRSTKQSHYDMLTNGRCRVYVATFKITYHNRLFNSRISFNLDVVELVPMGYKPEHSYTECDFNVNALTLELTATNVRKLRLATIYHMDNKDVAEFFSCITFAKHVNYFDFGYINEHDALLETLKNIKDRTAVAYKKKPAGNAFKKSKMQMYYEKFFKERVPKILSCGWNILNIRDDFLVDVMLPERKRLLTFYITARLDICAETLKDERLGGVFIDINRELLVYPAFIRQIIALYAVDWHLLYHYESADEKEEYHNYSGYESEI